MTFGKYEGENVDDIPTGYITWALANTNVSDDDPALAAELQNQLDAREGRGIGR